MIDWLIKKNETYFLGVSRMCSSGVSNYLVVLVYGFEYLNHQNGINVIVTYIEPGGRRDSSFYISQLLLISIFISKT